MLDELIPTLYISYIYNLSLQATRCLISGLCHALRSAAGPWKVNRLAMATVAFLAETTRIEPVTSKASHEPWKPEQKKQAH